jgi:hypothetical protein
MDSNTFVALACGRISGADAHVGVSVTGDDSIGRAVIDNFNMMI